MLVCRKSVHIKTTAPGENNMIFTQYIYYREAKEVILSVTASFPSCHRSAECSISVYRFDSNGENSDDRVNTLMYRPLLGNEETSKINPSNTELRFTRPADNITGFYLAFRDMGSIVSFSRVQLYYRICPAKNISLVIYPQVALPPNGSPPTIADAACQPHSHPLTSVSYYAYSDGRCVMEGECACNPGLIHGHTSFTSCAGESYTVTLVIKWLTEYYDRSFSLSCCYLCQWR